MQQKYWEGRTEAGEEWGTQPVLTEEQDSLPKEKGHFYRLISKCDTPQSRFGHAIKGWTVLGT